MANERGYSLVELLVVVALMGIVAVTMSGGIQFGARVWERTGTTVEALEQAQGAQAQLREALSSIAPSHIDPARPNDDAFAGRAEQMSFTTSTTMLPGSGSKRIVLKTVRAGNNVLLELEWRQDRGARAGGRQSLVHGATEISFTYGAIAPSGAITWSDIWPADAGLPALIRVRAKLGGGASWPDLIVRPQIDRAAQCEFDPLSLECRHG
jgi:prepilin-type N-terminal cleavage/methylation domain-containing protein